MQITVCPPATGQGQSANCAAPYSVFIPFSQTTNFGNLSQGVQLSTSNSLNLDYLTVNKGVGIGTGVGSDPIDIQMTKNAGLSVTEQNLSTGTSANTFLHLINDKGSNVWIGDSGSQYNASGAVLPTQPYQYPDTMQIFSDNGNGVMVTYAANFQFFGNVTGTWNATAPVLAVSTNADWGVLINHMGNWPNNNVPTVTGGTLAAGSRDTFGWIENVSASATLTFNHPFAGSQTVCTLTDAGQPLLWYASAQTTTSVTFNCIVPNTGAACTAGQGWVEYHCAGMNG
jgi:hypothetical protein